MVESKIIREMFVGSNAIPKIGGEKDLIIFYYWNSTANMQPGICFGIDGRSRLMKQFGSQKERICEVILKQ